MKRSLLLFLLTGLITVAVAQVPGTLSYQGLLVKADGTPVSDGDHNVKFDFYTVATAGTVVLSKGPFTVTTFKGMFTFILGSGTPTGNDPLPEALGASQHYIEVIADGIALTPRAQLTTVPYAIKAQSANTMNAIGLSGTIKVVGDNVGIGTSTPNAPMQLANEIKNRKIVLWEDVNNDHGYYGFGINGSMLRYQVSNVGASHAFYSGASVSTSNELLRIVGNGNVGIGTAAPKDLLHIKKLNTNNFLRIESGSQSDFLAGIKLVEENIDFGWTMAMSAKADELSFSHNNGSLSTTRVTFLPSGNVGIGTTAPAAPLHVGSTGADSPIAASSYFFQSTSTTLTNATVYAANVQIRADGWYWANGGGFYATSDSRTKNILGKTDNNNDLKSLMDIEITDYKYIDEISNGSKEHKKVIAQQLQEVYPTSVNMTSGVIPNVFETAKKVTVSATNTTIETTKPHHFSTGDEVKLILDKAGEKTFTVIVINENEFSVNELITEPVFVYGRKVEDLLIVDYDALTTLNISATQELSKQLEILKEKQKTIEIKQQRIEQLEARIETLSTTISTELKTIKRQFNANGKTPAVSNTSTPTTGSSVPGSSKK